MELGKPSAGSTVRPDGGAPFLMLDSQATGKDDTLLAHGH